MATYQEYAKDQLKAIGQKEPSAANMRDFALLSLFVANTPQEMQIGEPQRSESLKECISDTVKINPGTSEFKAILNNINLNQKIPQLIDLFDELLAMQSVLYPAQYQAVMYKIKQFQN